jgi:hypothetical protein
VRAVSANKTNLEIRNRFRKRDVITLVDKSYSARVTGRRKTSRMKVRISTEVATHSAVVDATNDRVRSFSNEIGIDCSFEKGLYEC